MLRAELYEEQDRLARKEARKDTIDDGASAKPLENLDQNSLENKTTPDGEPFSNSGAFGAPTGSLYVSPVIGYSFSCQASTGETAYSVRQPASAVAALDCPPAPRSRFELSTNSSTAGLQCRSRMESRQPRLRALNRVVGAEPQ